MSSYLPLIESFDKLMIHFQSQAVEKFSLYSKGETCALHFLLEKGDYVLPGEISEAVHCSAARITKLITQLEQKGHVIREIDKNDRRKIKVKLTKSGYERALREREEFFKNLEQIFIEMGEEDSKEFIRTIKIFFSIAGRLEMEDNNKQLDEERNY